MDPRRRNPEWSRIDETPPGGRSSSSPRPWRLLAASEARAAADEGRPVRLAAAAERGAFNVGASRGNVSVVADPQAGDVLKLDYSVPAGTAVGAWTKGFPPDLAADVVSAAVKATGADPVAVALEIKGTAGVQRIPLTIQPDWAGREWLLDWTTIGSLKEVVVSVSRSGDDPPSAGTLLFDIRFERLPPLRKLGLSPAARFGGVVLAALVAAALAALLRFANPRGGRTSRGLGRDLVQGIGVVAVAALALGIDVIGGLGPLEVGWAPIWLALAGAALAEWWKFGLTGKHLTPAEALRDALATGLLAASVGPIPILQAPAHWSDLRLLSQPVASALAFLYHAANAYRLAASGRHLGGIVGAMIVGTPYAVGWLLMLEPGGLVRSLGDLLTAGALADRPAGAEFVGRVAVLFGFNELVANALGLATKRRPIRSGLAHHALFAVAVAAVAGPWIARWGSGGAVDSVPGLDRLLAAVAGVAGDGGVGRFATGVVRLLAVVATTALSQGGLWAEAYLLTGMVLDAIHGAAPSRESTLGHPALGMKKGMVYSGTFMGALGLGGLLAGMPEVRRLAGNTPLIFGMLAGALVFPFVKTIVETFDGSQAFFRRVAASYRKPMLYARGAVVGIGLAYGLSHGMSGESMLDRVAFGFFVGASAYAGVNLLGDLVAARAGRGRVQSWRVFAVQAMLGGAIGAAIGFYLDATQVRVIIDKFHRYVDPGQKPSPFGEPLLLSRWGFIRLGDEMGGPSLLFAEALAGVLSWAIPSWLFAINRTFMAAYFDREPAPIRSLFTRAGLVQVVESMIGVLRWGLWMSPIIKSFLRPMGDPTWYNQDGAIRTALAVVHDVATPYAEFRAWSLNVFIALMAYDWIRILIWLDHFGLRVATLVNLSFLGMDRLDRRLARFLAPAATARCVPEAVKRFTTWAPLLIPFYIPRGKEWDIAWSQSQAIQAWSSGDLFSSITSLPRGGMVTLAAVSAVAATAAFSAARWWVSRAAIRRRAVLTVENAVYEVAIRDDGEVMSRVKGREYDVSRRSYDLLDPAGRALFLVDAPGDGPSRAWPVVGNVPGTDGESSLIERDGAALRVINTRHGLRTTVEITLPSDDDAAEVWTIDVENLTDGARRIKVIPYLEWVLNRADADRGHTQYNRLFAEVEYVGGLHAVLAWDKHSKALGVLASDVAPEGFLSSRVDFIGRARSLWMPRVVETLDFTEARDTDAHPTLDPIGSLLIGATVPPRGSSRIRLLTGLVADKRRAIDPAPRAPSRHPAGGGRACRAETEGVAPDRPRRDPAGDAPDLYRVLRRRPPFDRPDALHDPTVRSHDVECARPYRRRHEPRAAHHVERQLPAEPGHARLVRYRHARGFGRGVLPL